MRTIYNGVDLGVLELYAFDWEPVYTDDGADYLFTRIMLMIRGFINGQAEVLNPVNGFQNGPGISYALGSLQSPPIYTAELGGKNQQTRTVTLASGFDQRAAPPNLAGVGGGAPPFGGVGAQIAAQAKKFASAKLPPLLTPNAAFRKLPPPAVTRRNSPNARIEDMSIPQGAGIDQAPRNQLRQIVRVPNAAPLSHAAIRHRLTTPLGKLYVFAGPGQESGKPAPGSDDPPSEVAQLVVQAPQNPNWRTDAHNGPKPKLLGIHAALGDANTLLVDWQCEAYVNEAELNGVTNYGALLSNRFSQTHVVRDDGYSVIFTAGTAIFRSDFVYALPESPDLKRPVLLQPIPRGFTRAIDSITGRSDALGVDYAYTDTQVASNFVAGVYCGAASISAVHRQAIVSGGSILKGALSTYERVLNLMALKNWSKDDRPSSADEKGGARPKRRGPGPVRGRVVMPPDTHPGPMFGKRR